MFTVFYNHILEAMKQERLSLEEVATTIKAHGIEGVEMDYRDISNGMLSLDTVLPQKLRALGIPINSVYVFFDWANHPLDLSYRRVLKNIVSIGVKYVMIIPGMTPDSMSEARAMDRLIKKLKKVVDYADSLGLTVTLEDFDDKVASFSTSKGMKQYFREIDKLKCAFDTGNFFYSDEDALSLLPDFINNTVYVHCKDRKLTENPGEKPQINISGKKMYASAVGEGVIPMEEIVKTLVRNGYNGTFAIEHFGSMNHLRDMIASATNLTRWIEEVK